MFYNNLNGLYVSIGNVIYRTEFSNNSLKVIAVNPEDIPVGPGGTPPTILDCNFADVNKNNIVDVAEGLQDSAGVITADVIRELLMKLNTQTLSKFSEDIFGTLLFNNNPVGGSGSSANDLTITAIQNKINDMNTELANIKMISHEHKKLNVLELLGEDINTDLTYNGEKVKVDIDLGTLTSDIASLDLSLSTLNSVVNELTMKKHEHLNALTLSKFTTLIDKVQYDGKSLLTVDDISTLNTSITNKFDKITDTTDNITEGVNKKFISADLLNKLINMNSVFTFKNFINTSSDFPTKADVLNGWTYEVRADSVIDSDITKTNTGTTFTKGDIITWVDTAWISSGNTSGDMLKVVYDTNADGIIDFAESLKNGATTITVAQISKLLTDSHIHDNSTVLSNLTETPDGKLMYRGKLLGAGGIGDGGTLLISDLIDDINKSTVKTYSSYYITELLKKYALSTNVYTMFEADNKFSLKNLEHSHSNILTLSKFKENPSGEILFNDTKLLTSFKGYTYNKTTVTTLYEELTEIVNIRNIITTNTINTILNAEILIKNELPDTVETTLELIIKNKTLVLEHVFLKPQEVQRYVLGISPDITVSVKGLCNSDLYISYI